MLSTPGHCETFPNKLMGIKFFRLKRCFKTSAKFLLCYWNKEVPPVYSTTFFIKHFSNSPLWLASFAPFFGRS